MDLHVQILNDALFAAIAAIGFSAISRPPRRAYLYCALIAAAGHSLRFILINFPPHLNIIPASLLAAMVIGFMAVGAAALAKFPAETCLFPALLPMIPGIYAYKTFGGLVMSLLAQGQDGYDYYFYLFSYNGMMCCGILFALVLGATLPIFILKKISFQATR